MNNKGYTLVELLATVVILGIVMSIAAYGVIGAINKSKARSEKIFVDSLEKEINTYISKNRFKFNTGSNIGSFNKCHRSYEDSGNCYNDEEYKVDIYEIEDDFSLDLLANEEYIKGGKIINPKNKLDCLSGNTFPQILLFKDDESVYYYYVDLDDLSCDISDDNRIISNIPKSMCIALGGTYEEECVKNE